MTKAILLVASTLGRFRVLSVMAAALLGPWSCEAQTVQSTLSGLHAHNELAGASCSFPAPPNWVSTGTGFQLNTSVDCSGGLKAGIQILVTISPATITGVVLDAQTFALRAPLKIDVTATVTPTGNKNVPHLILGWHDINATAALLAQCQDLTVDAASAHNTCMLNPDPAPGPATPQIGISRDQSSSPARDYFAIEAVVSVDGVYLAQQLFITPQFTEGGVAPDSVSLRNVTPSPGSKLPPQSTQQFTATADYTLSSAASGKVALIVTDQNGATIGSSSAVDVSQGTSSTPPTTAAVTLPASGAVTLKAVLSPAGGTPTPSAGITYTIGGGSIAIDHVEVVQGIQNQAGTAVPYIAGKPALVRVFVNSTGPNDVPGVTGTVKPAIALDHHYFMAHTTNYAIERDNQLLSLNFVLLSPPLGTVNLSIDVSAPDGTKDHRDMAVVFSLPSGIPAAYYVGYIPICITDNVDPPLCPDGPDVLDSMSDAFAEEIFPFPSGTIVYFPLPVPKPPVVSGFVGKLYTPFPDFDFRFSQSLFKSWVFLNVYPLPGAPRLDHLTAWIPRLNANGGRPFSFLWYEDLAQTYHLTRKISWQPSHAAPGLPIPAETLAHQLGHQLGLGDLPFTHVVEPGFDPSEFLQPTQYQLYVTNANSDDIMDPRTANGGFAWISINDTNAILTAKTPPVPAVAEPASDATPGSASASAPAANAVDYVVVSGTVQRDGSGGQIDPVYHVSTAKSQIASNPSGNHCLQFSNSGGMLGQYCFDLDVSATGVAGLNQQMFAVTAPWPAGTTRLSLMRNGQQLAALTAAQDPVVTILSPKTGDRWQGTNTITWSVSGVATSGTLYTVLYSADGGNTWLPMVTDISDTSYSFDSAQILGGSQVLFRVMAANGLNSGSATAGPIQVVQAPQIGPSGASLDFGNLTSGTGTMRTIGITNSGTGPLIMGNVGVDNPAFTVLSTSSSMPIAVGGQRNVTVILSAAASGKQSGTLTIQSNDPVTPAFKIPLNAQAFDAPTPSIATASTSLDFGNVPVNQSVDMMVSIANSGSADLNVTSIGSSNGQFSAPTPVGSFTVAAQMSANVTLRFKPSGLGMQSATITVASNDPTHGSFPISVRGMGVSANTPYISAGGVVNAASFQGPIARGALASIFGSNLASGMALTGPLPLQTSMLGTQVTVGGLLAPLVYVSPSQINFQVPYEVPTGPPAAVVVTSNGLVSSSASAPMADYNVGVFTYARTASALDPIIVHAVTNQLVTPSNPAVPNEYLVVYATGIGKLSNPPQTGQGAPLTPPLSQAADLPNITLGSAPVSVLFAGLTPGFVGLVQINIQLPASLPSGSSLPLAISFPGNAVPVVNLAVQSAGVSPPKLGLSTNALAFGTVTVNQTKDLSVVVSNTGGGTLNATVKPPGTGFNLLSATSLTIAAGQSTTLSVRFAPASVTTYNSTVVITSNDPASPATITLSGTGQAAAPGDVVLQVDGGKFANEVGYSSGTATAYFVNRLTPPSYPATIKSVQIFFRTRSDGLPLNTPLTVISATNPSGTSAISIASAGSIDLTSGKISALDQFVTYTVPARTITSGDFVVGFFVQNPANVYPADLDQLTQSQGRSYVSNDGINFFLLDSIMGLAGNLGIRAVVTTGN